MLLEMISVGRSAANFSFKHLRLTVPERGNQVLSKSKKSSSGRKRRLPAPSYGFDINFYRNPACGQFAIAAPDPFDGRTRTTSSPRRRRPTSMMSSRGLAA